MAFVDDAFSPHRCAHCEMFVFNSPLTHFGRLVNGGQVPLQAVISAADDDCLFASYLMRHGGGVDGERDLDIGIEGFRGYFRVSINTDGLYHSFGEFWFVSESGMITPDLVLILDLHSKFR